MKIIHQKVAVGMPPSEMKVYHEAVRRVLPRDEYHVITTPTDLTLLDSESFGTLVTTGDATFDMKSLESSQKTIGDLIKNNLALEKLYEVKVKVIKALETRLKEENELAIISAKNEHLKRYNEYANLLIELKYLDIQKFGQLDLKGRKDSLVEFVLEAIEYK